MTDDSRVAPPADGQTDAPIADLGPTRQPLLGGQLNAALARGIVRIQNKLVGRGPTKARAFFRDNYVVVIMEDAMTTLERTLAGDSNPEAVLALRRQLQESMRSALVAEVERLTGRQVVAFMSGNHIDPDLSSELFVLDKAIAGERADAEPVELD